ncbi:hypothetical protein [Nocardioides panacisoli]|uniref:XRE family transcriptional regulator n=1 Tax=Nocardioides panacisoli TaxID=627624 RepID=A0ABP7HWI1_9ACTN
MSPFLRADSQDIREVLADGAVQVLTKRGADGVNVAALARWMGITRQALSERLWDADGPRSRIIRLTVATFGERWLGWTAAALLSDPPVPALPAGPEEAHGVRVWIALAELARGEDAVGKPDPLGVVGRVRRDERDDLRHRLADWLRAYPADDDVDELLALAEGLRAALVAPSPTVSLDAARRILVRRLDAIRQATPAAHPPRSA